MNRSLTLPSTPHSYWMASTPETNYPKLDKDFKTQVAIIGGGMAGITTGYFLTRAGMKVTIIDADRILQGTTAHTTAKLTSQHGLVYASIKKQHGEEAARQYADANEMAIKKLAEIAQEHHIDCDLITQPAYVYTQQDQYIKQIEDEVKTARTLGIDAHYLDSIPLDIPIKAAIRFDNQAQFHPLKFLKPLAEWIVNHGGQIFEQTAAVNLEGGDSYEIVVTRDGHRIQADKIVIATHYPFFDGGAFYFSKMYQERDYIIAITMDKPFPGGMYITAESPTRSLRSQPYEDGELVLVVGDEHRTGSGENTEQHYQNLLEFASQQFPVNKVLYRWSAQDCKTPDSIPYVGNLTGQSPNIYVATGFQKWGMTNSMAAAMIISDLLTKGDNPWAQVYSPLRFTSLKGIGFILEHNIKVAKDYVVGKMTVNPQEEEIPAGEARVLNLNGRRMGVYKDEQGEMHRVDITCTHLGCELKWNQAEKTWDCPCHGSRFSYEGDIIEGPTFTCLNHNSEEANRVEARVFS